MALQMTADELCSKIQSTYSYTSSYKKKVLEADTDVQNIKDNIEEFRNNVRELKKYSDGFTTKSKLERQLKKFVKSYNDMKKNSESISKEELNKELSELDKFISDNEKALKKIGIKVSNDTLTFDSEVFEEAEEDDFDTIFIGKDCFINQVNKLMRGVERSADDAEYDLINKKISRTIRYDKEKVDLVASLNVLDGTVSSLTEKAADGTIKNEDASLITEYLREFCSSYNSNVINKSEVDTSNNLDKIKKMCEENENKLSSIGIALDVDNGKMIFNESVNLEDADFKEAYLSLFGEEASFGKLISQYCKDIFQSVIAPDKIGVTIKDATIIDQYI